MHTLARTCGADTAGQCSRHGAPCKATAGSSEVQRCSLAHPRSPLGVTATCSLQSPPALGALLCPSPGDLIELGGCVTQPNQTGSLLPPQAPPPLPGGDPCPRPRWVLAGSGGWEGRGCVLTRVGRCRAASLFQRRLLRTPSPSRAPPLGAGTGLCRAPAGPRLSLWPPPCSGHLRASAIVPGWDPDGHGPELGSELKTQPAPVP